MSELREKYQNYVNVSADALARDLASLLNRAKDLGIAVCPDVGDDGISYMVSWYFGGHRYRDVEYNGTTEKWRVKGGSDD